MHVYFQAHKVEVALVDTSGPEDIHINDMLEREGLAQFMTSRQPQPPPPPVQRVTLLQQILKFRNK